MQALTDRVKPVDRRPLNFVEKLYIPAILRGMGITFKHIFQKKATVNYPEETRPFSPVFRGLHILNRDEEGRERCTACGLCAVACPAEAITMWLMGVAGLGIILAAVYTLNMLQKVIFGESNALTATTTDLQNSELLALSLIVGVILVLGVYPKPMPHWL